MASNNGSEPARSLECGSNESTPLIDKNTPEDEAQGPVSRDGDGLSVKDTTLLIAGEMAGSGVLALPRALVRTGWIGVPIIILLCAIAAFSGKRLGDCWSIIEERNPQMRGRKRNPYAIIANEALGKTWSVIVSIAITTSLFGASVVYLLMSAQIIEEVLRTVAPSVNYCLWYVIVVAAVSPLMFFGSPKDFAFTGTVAFGATISACILYFIQMMNDAKPFRVFRWGIHGFQDFFLAFGTVMFAFGGASTFPTIQNDMAEKKQFHRGIQYSFSAVLCLYLTMAVTGYAVYGESVAPNLAMSLSSTPLTLVGNILMAVHLLSAFVIIINPVSQELEELYKVPRDSMGWRIIIRASIMLGILFIGETIPRFHTILALIGGTTIALLTFVLPTYCYIKLVAQAAPGDNIAEEPGWMRVVCWEVILVGVVGGAAATFSAVSAIFSNSQATPCYLR